MNQKTAKELVKLANLNRTAAEAKHEADLICFTLMNPSEAKHLMFLLRDRQKELTEASESAGDVKVSMTGKERSGMSKASKPEKPSDLDCIPQGKRGTIRERMARMEDAMSKSEKPKAIKKAGENR